MFMTSLFHPQIAGNNLNASQKANAVLMLWQLKSVHSVHSEKYGKVSPGHR